MKNAASYSRSIKYSDSGSVANGGVKVHGLHFRSAVHGFACTELTLALTPFVHVAPVQHFGNAASVEKIFTALKLMLGNMNSCAPNKNHTSEVRQAY